MDRKEFLATLGKGAAVAAALYCVGCSANSAAPTEPAANVDFTLDLGQSAYQVLQSTGGSVYKDSIIIARVSQTEFVAVSQICTHQGSTIQYDSANKRFHCPSHGSNFSLDGSVINGPAGRALVKYNTSLSGNSLRIFS